MIIMHNDCDDFACAVSETIEKQQQQELGGDFSNKLHLEPEQIFYITGCRIVSQNTPTSTQLAYHAKQVRGA